MTRENTATGELEARVAALETRVSVMLQAVLSYMNAEAHFTDSLRKQDAVATLHAEAETRR